MTTFIIVLMYLLYIVFDKRSYNKYKHILFSPFLSSCRDDSGSLGRGRGPDEGEKDKS